MDLHIVSVATPALSKVQLAAVTCGHPEVFMQKATVHHLQCQLSYARFASCVICATCVQEAAHAV